MGQKQKCKEEHENQDSVRGIIWDWEDLDHSPGSHALLFWLKGSLEIYVNRTCLEFSAAWSHCSGHSTDSEVFLYPGADSNLSHRFLRLKWNKIVFNFVGPTWDSLGLIFQTCDKATALASFLQGSAGTPLCATSTSCIFEIRKNEKWDAQAWWLLFKNFWVFPSVTPILIKLSIQFHCFIPVRYSPSKTSWVTSIPPQPKVTRWFSLVFDRVWTRLCKC